MPDQTGTKAPLITDAQRQQLLANGREWDRNPDFDPEPVMRLVVPRIRSTWLLCSLQPDEPTIAFVLADLGCGSPELGSVWLTEIQDTCASLGLQLVADVGFVPVAPISAYARAARRAGQIVALRRSEDVP